VGALREALAAREQQVAVLTVRHQVGEEKNIT
jgi:hypothetical protein